jgi:hypothetical protein
LYASMALVLVRCVYRLVEHASSGAGAVDLKSLEALRRLSVVRRYEWWFYVFETALMLGNSVLWNVWHPGRYLPKGTGVYLAEDGTMERERVRDRDGRGWLARAGNVGTFGLLFRRRKEAEGAFREVDEVPLALR